MQALIIEAKSSHIIHGGDCDILGHLNNTKYVEYFHNAREDHLINVYKYNMAHLIKTESAFVVGSQQIFYFRSAMCYETVVIQSSIIHIEESKITVEFIMFNEAETEVKSIMWTEYFAIDKTTGKSEKVTEERNEFFHTVLNKEVDYQKGILARYKDLRGKLSK